MTLLSDQVASGLNQERLIAGLTSLFGILALGLAWWVCSASCRTRCPGARPSSGSAWRSARSAKPALRVFRESLTVVMGDWSQVFPLLWASRGCSRISVFGVSPAIRDPISATLLVGVAALASFVPPGGRRGSIRWLRYGASKRRLKSDTTYDPNESVYRPVPLTRHPQDRFPLSPAMNSVGVSTRRPKRSAETKCRRLSVTTTSAPAARATSAMCAS